MVETETVEPYGEIGIGEDVPQVEAKQVTIEDYEITPVIDKTSGKETGKKIVLKVKHPDVTDRLIEISGAKYIVAEKLKSTGLWWKEDKEGKIPHKSAIAYVLRHYKATNLQQLRGKAVITETNENNYLVVKAY